MLKRWLTAAAHPGRFNLFRAAAGPPPSWYGVATVVFTSAALLIPCFWHSRIQAGDFGSHVYNAWLADQIRVGGLQGLELVRPWTNFLFDELLSAMIRLTGYGAGQRLAAALVVLTFFWGAFRFVSALNSAPVWPVTPLLAVLTYGSTFHAGFFNFLLGVGLSLWAMALLLRPRPTKIIIAVVLLSLAVTAHAMPVVCAGGILAYIAIARHISKQHLALVFVTAFLCTVLARFAITALFSTTWFPEQLINATGLNQAWVFGEGYSALVPPMLAVILSVLWRISAVRDTVVHLWVLAGANAVLIPTRIDFPGFAHGLYFVSDRFSLIAGVLILAVAGRVKLRWYEFASLVAVAVVFFVMLYFDTGKFDRLEDRIEIAVSTVPHGSRVVLGMQNPRGRVDPLVHLIDRACVGRCFSYGNYEPSTKQFRVRAVAPNSFVAHTYGDSFEIQIGRYRVRPRDQPLFAVYAEKAEVRVRELGAGEMIPRTLAPF